MKLLVGLEDSLVVSCCCGDDEVSVELVRLDRVLREGRDASTAIFDLHIHEIGCFGCE